MWALWLCLAVLAVYVAVGAEDIRHHRELTERDRDRDRSEGGPVDEC